MNSRAHGRALNSVRLRSHNERLVLQTLQRAGEASRAELACATGLTITAVGSILQSLDQAGLIQFGDRQSGERERPVTPIRLDTKGAFGIGVRLDRDSIETALVDFGGEILARRVHDRILPSPDETLKLVRNDIDTVLDPLTPTERTRLAGIGVSQTFDLGSWVDQFALSYADFSAWNEADFAFELGVVTGLPVFSENDGNAAAIAELSYGCGREYDDFVYVFFGPVIGCGVALDGNCLRGVSGNAGDIAAMPVAPSRLASAPKCDGNWDLLLSRASLGALVRHLRHAGETVATHAELSRLIMGHHPAVEEWIDDCVEALAPALQSAMCILDVPLAVIDADVDEGLVDLLMRRLNTSLEASTPAARSTLRVIRGSFGADAGAVGAASLPMFFSFAPRTEVLQNDTKTQEWHARRPAPAHDVARICRGATRLQHYDTPPPRSKA